MPMTPLVETSPAPARRGIREWATRGTSALRGQTMLLAVANVGSQVISFICGVVVARWLGTTGRGQVSLVQAYDETSTNVLSLGIPEAAGYLAKERVATEAKVLGAALRLSLFTLPFTAALGWVVATFAFKDYPTGIQLTAWTAVGMTPLVNSFLAASRMLLVARGQIRSLVPLTMVPITVRLGALLLLIALGVFSATTAAVTFVLTGWMGNFMAWRTLKVRPRRGGSVRPLIGYGVKTIPTSIAHMANGRLDQLLIAPLLGSAALGIYAVGVGVNVLPLAAGAAIAAASYHKVVGTGRDSPEIGHIFRRGAIAIAGCAVLSAIGIVLLLEPVYGPAFRDSVVVALILVPGIAATGLFMIVSSTAYAIGDPVLAAKAEVAGMLITVAGLPLLLPSLGVNGAALVSTTANVIRLVIGLWLLYRRGLPIRLHRKAAGGPDESSSNGSEDSR